RRRGGLGQPAWGARGGVPTPGVPGGAAPQEWTRAARVGCRQRVGGLLCIKLPDFQLFLSRWPFVTPRDQTDRCNWPDSGNGLLGTSPTESAAAVSFAYTTKRGAGAGKSFYGGS